MIDRDTRRGSRRFPIAASLLYRERGDSAWRVASTINVSRSGVLFRTDVEAPRADGALDFILTLPLDGGTPAPHVRCTGRVVRTALDEFVGGGRVVAVSIDGYALGGRLPV